MEVSAEVDGRFRKNKSQMEVLKAYWKGMEVGGSREIGGSR